MREATIAEPEAPAAWIMRFAPLIPCGRPVLDVACGAGRHARLFLERGHPVTAVDVDTGPITALRRYPGLGVVQADLESGGPWPFPGREFAGVVVTNYLWRPLFPHLIDALAPGGVLLYETFAVGHAAYGKPARPEFLLRPGELLDLVRGRLQVVAYEHGYVAEPRPSVRQRICAAKAAEPLPLTPRP
jgi:SAM-dependent methyltransferase